MRTMAIQNFRLRTFWNLMIKSAASGTAPAYSFFSSRLTKEPFVFIQVVKIAGQIKRKIVRLAFLREQNGQSDYRTLSSAL